MLPLWVWKQSNPANILNKPTRIEYNSHKGQESPIYKMWNRRENHPPGRRGWGLYSQSRLFVEGASYHQPSNCWWRDHFRLSSRLCELASLPAPKKVITTDVKTTNRFVFWVGCPKNRCDGNTSGDNSRFLSLYRSYETERTGLSSAHNGLCTIRVVPEKTRRPPHPWTLTLNHLVCLAK